MSKKKDCLHEAGRAVMLWLLGKSWDIIKIDMRAKPNQRTQIRDFLYGTANMISRTNINDRETEQYVTGQAKIAVMYFLSGLAIYGRIDGAEDWLEAEMDACEWGTDKEHDLYRAVKVLKSLYGDSKKADQSLVRWARWCDEAFSNSKVWGCVESLAGYLHKTKSPITGPQIKKFLHNVWAVAGPPYRALGRKWRERFDV